MNVVGDSGHFVGEMVFGEFHLKDQRAEVAGQENQREKADDWRDEPSHEGHGCE